MRLSASYRDRLSSAAIALAVQAGLAALLLLSATIIHQLPAEKETIFILPQLQQPKAPMVIDGRRRPQLRPPAIPATPPIAAPAPAASSAQDGDNGLLQELGKELAGCKPENAGRGCPATDEGVPHQDEATLNPPSQVKDAARWQSEIERRNTPPRVPCVSLTSNIVGMGGFQIEDRGARLDISCALKEWRNPTLLPPVSGTPVSDPGPRRASDAAFRKALAAVQERQRSIYSMIAAVPAAQAGGTP